VRIEAAGGIGEMLRLLAGLERGSEHPLAAAIIDAAESRGVARESAAEFHAHAGKGVVGVVAGRRVALGNVALLAELGIDDRTLTGTADAARHQGETVMFAAIDGKLAGLVAVADPIKETARAALDALRGEGLRIVMLTGDNRATAEAVARRLGITEVIAEVLPEQKTAAIRRLHGEGRVVAMAGDGINDAPALAAATIGIAMGGGTDIAIASAAITLVKGDLGSILRARRLSHAVMANIRQNLFFAFAFNALAIPIAAGVLYPSTGLLLSPMIASAAMSLSSVTVIANALRLRRVPLY
jgi:Cu+-exporting ATPase